MNKESLAVLNEVHTLITRDNIRIKNNIQKAMQITARVSLIDNKIKPFDSKRFYKFFENQLGEVALLHKKVKEILIVS